MGFAPRTKAELCWWQFLRLPQCLGDFLHPLALALPLLGTCVLHTDPVSQMWSWGSATLVPRQEWHPRKGHSSALKLPGSPFSAAEPDFFSYSFTENNIVLWFEWKKSWGFFYVARNSWNSLRHNSKTSVSEYFTSFPSLHLSVKDWAGPAFSYICFQGSNFSFLPVTAREKRLHCLSVFNVQFQQSNGHLMVQIDLIPDLDLLT